MSAAVPKVPVIAVASGKGGVGKTSVAVALARALVAAGRRIGLVDADLHGPDVPRMLGLRRDTEARSLTVASWVGARQSRLEAMDVEGLKVASAAFLMGGQQGLAAGSAIGDLLLARLLRETEWGPLDALVVDLPPGTGEVQQALLGLVGQVAAVLVVTPAEVSHLDSGRALTVLKAAQVQILGGVENMAYLECPGCTEHIALHVPAAPDRTIWARGVPRLDSVPHRQDATIRPADLTGLLAVAGRYVDGGR